jgi:ribosomal protein L33
MDKKTIKVKATEGEGYLYFKSKKPKTNSGKIEMIKKGEYKMLVKGDGSEVVVSY